MVCAAVDPALSASEACYSATWALPPQTLRERAWEKGASMGPGVEQDLSTGLRVLRLKGGAGAKGGDEDVVLDLDVEVRGGRVGCGREGEAGGRRGVCSAPLACSLREGPRKSVSKEERFLRKHSLRISLRVLDEFVVDFGRFCRYLDSVIDQGWATIRGRIHPRGERGTQASGVQDLFRVRGPSLDQDSLATLVEHSRVRHQAQDACFECLQARPHKEKHGSASCASCPLVF